jgi:glycosyltransferase involved in cell wall biosynthesis
MSQRRVVYWNNIPAPYVVERFNALAERGRLDFEAWFSWRTLPDRSWAVEEATWKFRHRYLPNGKVGRRQCALPTAIISRAKPDLLVSLYASPSFLTGWSIARARHIRTAFWVEATHDRWTPRSWWKEALKRRIFPKVDGFFTTGDDGRAFVERYGARADRVFYLPYFADYETFARGAAEAWPRRDEIRAELGVRGITFLNVGRLWWGKGLDTLIAAFAQVQQRTDREMSLVLVGDGEEEARLRKQAEDLGAQNVIFGGFRSKPELAAIYAASEVFVFPTLGDPYGLVLDEAMAAGLPAISTTAAGEIRTRITDGVSGMLVPPGDVAALAAKMEVLASDDKRRREMAEAAPRRLKGLSAARWAELFEEAVAVIVGSSDSRVPSHPAEQEAVR